MYVCIFLFIIYVRNLALKKKTLQKLIYNDTKMMPPN